ncbi:MAG: hypothetical protein LUH10_18380 [Tannerellaceae bacterium]|nr:hypothetical protein [Tannerellaceae bacterium]
MEKKYTFDDENKEENVMKEPITGYKFTSPAEYSLPLTEEEYNLLEENLYIGIPTDTPDNIRKAVYKAMEQEKNGEYKTHAEALKMFPFLYE